MDQKTIAKVRAFNRFYTAIIGVLDQDYLETECSLTEARLLFELNANPQGVTAKYLTDLLRIDKGYLSRLIRGMFKSGLVDKQQEKEDKRAFRLRLTKKGTGVFKLLNSRSEAQVKGLLSGLTTEQVKALADHMEAIKHIIKDQFNSNIKGQFNSIKD